MLLRNLVFCLKNWKLWWALTTIELNIFCWNFAPFLFTNVYRRVFRIFSFCLDLELFAKVKKDLVSAHSFFTFTNNSRSKQNKKIPNTLLQTLLSSICVQKILNFVVVGAHQSFQLFRQIAWCLGYNRALSKFRYWILYNLISISKL